jgi:DNA-binding PadR family transcriptional regulator
MHKLTRKEEMIMMAILNLEEEAYLVAITYYLTKLTEKTVNLASTHLPLSRLEQAGLIVSEMGEATAVRGGRRKKIYRITEEGFAVLEEHKQITDRLWKRFSGRST